MKKVIFGTNNIDNGKAALIVIINNFLNKHGANTTYLYVDNDLNLCINTDITNANYMKALGLLFLLFTENNEYMHIKLHKNSSIEFILKSNATYSQVIKYIEDRMDITIEY